MKALFLTAMVVTAACTRTPGAVQPDSSGRSVSVMSYNVDFQHAGDAETVRAIEAANVDVVLLQEVNQVWQEALQSTLSATYPHQVYYGDDGYAGGLAILSKWPIASVAKLQRVDWFPALRATVQTPIGPLQTLNVHLRPQRTESGNYLVGYFTTPRLRESEIRAYTAALDADLPSVIAGDFNEGDGGRAIRWLTDLGYRNALPQYDAWSHTWQWPVGWITLTARLDHILYDDALELLQAETPRVGRSDHFPVVGVFASSRLLRPGVRDKTG